MFVWTKRHAQRREPRDNYLEFAGRRRVVVGGHRRDDGGRGCGRTPQGLRQLVELVAARAGAVDPAVGSGRDGRVVHHDAVDVAAAVDVAVAGHRRCRVVNDVTVFHIVRLSRVQHVVEIVAEMILRDTGRRCVINRKPDKTDNDPPS